MAARYHLIYPRAASGLTQTRRFEGVTLGELGELDLQVGDDLGELGSAPGKPSAKAK